MIRCIAIDDEPLALEQIARFIGRIPELRLLGTALTVSKAKELLEREEVELVFLDIEMPGCNGADFAEWLREQGSSASVIFTTAYPQYAARGFRLDAVDYLLKPLSFEELQEAVEKAVRRIAPPAREQDDTAEQTIFVKIAGAVRQIPVADIVYVQGLSAYVQICVKGEPRLLTTHESLKHLETLLPADWFLRIHKSYIINIRHLEAYDHASAIIGGRCLPIGQKYRPSFKQTLKQKLTKTNLNNTQPS